MAQKVLTGTRGGVQEVGSYRKYEVVICNLLNYGMSRNSEVMAVFHIEK
jgi:hypothetical protein